MRTRGFPALAFAAGALGLLMWPVVAGAQPKPGYSPSTSHIFPAGGRRGTKLKVYVGAECLPPSARFLLTGGGVSAPDILGDEIRLKGEPSPRREPTEIPITYPREWASEITIAADAPLGPAYWRLSCAQGGTGSRPFLVGELPEWIEKESNSFPEKAEPVVLPITVNGRIHGERDVDYFRFEAAAGDVVVCDVLAGRLGSRLDPVASLHDADGRPLDVQEIRVGSDPVLALRVETPGAYLLRIANVTVHGGPSYVYRVNISTAPYVEFAFPAGGQAGTDRDVEFSVLTGTGIVRTLRRQVKFPKQSANESLSFHFSPPNEAEGRQGNSGGSVSLAVDDLPNMTEQEPNDTQTDAGELSLPVTIDGRTLTADDEDWFRFTAEKGEAISIRCRAFPIGTAALPTLLLKSSDGKTLAQSRSVDSADRRCGIEWTAPATGTWFLRVRDMQFGARGGDDFIYRLSLRKSDPDFSLELASDALNVMQGGTSKLSVKLKRFGGLTAPVKLAFTGLPDGVTVDATEIPAGKNEVSVTLSASDEVLSHSFTLKLSGTAEIGEKVIQRSANARHLGIDAEGVGVGPTTLDHLNVTVLHKPLFRLFCAEAYQYAYRGSIYPYLMEVERLDGFDGEIILQQGDRQNRDMDGVNILNATVPPGETDVVVPIYLPETMHINVQSQSQLYSQAFATFVDKGGRKQSVLVLSEKRNMLRTLPPVVKLKSVTSEIRVRPGGQARCRFRLERTTNFPGPMQLQLRDGESPQGFTLEAVRIDSGEIEVDLAVQVSSNVSPGTRRTLTFRATGELGQHTIVTEATLTIHVE